MPGQYFAYIPFGANTDELQRGVEQWSSSIDDANKAYAYLGKIADGLEKQIKTGGLGKTEAAEMQRKVEKLKARAALSIDARKKPTLLMHDGGRTKPLAVLDGYAPDEYTLAVVGHCAPGSTTLRETQSIRTSQGALTATELLNRMATDGLPKTIMNFKLLACYGARADEAHHQKSFSDAVWQALRGYCISVVKLTAYTEPVLLSEFYRGASDLDAPKPGKVFGKLELGTVVPDRIPVGGALSTVKKVYQSRPCLVCQRPILLRCKDCQSEFCSQACCNMHLVNEGNSCPAAVTT